MKRLRDLTAVLGMVALTACNNASIEGSWVEPGDLFSYKNLDFEVVDMDRGRVDKLLVIKKEEDE